MEFSILVRQLIYSETIGKSSICSTGCPSNEWRKYQRFALLVLYQFLHKGPIKGTLFPCHDAIADWHVSRLLLSYNCNPRQRSPENKVHWANMAPNWGRQDPGGPHGGHVNLTSGVGWGWGVGVGGGGGGGGWGVGGGGIYGCELKTISKLCWNLTTKPFIIMVWN